MIYFLPAGSFLKCKDWIEELKQNVPEDSGMFLSIASNKVDREDERQVTKEVAISYAQEVNAMLFETSAKENVGVEELFRCIFCSFSYLLSADCMVCHFVLFVFVMMTRHIGDKVRKQHNSSFTHCCIALTKSFCLLLSKLILMQPAAAAKKKIEAVAIKGKGDASGVPKKRSSCC